MHFRTCLKSFSVIKWEFVVYVGQTIIFFPHSSEGGVFFPVKIPNTFLKTLKISLCALGDSYIMMEHDK